jgi:hypothetical protein
MWGKHMTSSRTCARVLTPLGQIEYPCAYYNMICIDCHTVERPALRKLCREHIVKLIVVYGHKILMYTSADRLDISVIRVCVVCV